MTLACWLALGCVLCLNAGLLAARLLAARGARKATQRKRDAEARLAEWTVDENELEWAWLR